MLSEGEDKANVSYVLPVCMLLVDRVPQNIDTDLFHSNVEFLDKIVLKL